MVFPKFQRNWYTKVLKQKIKMYFYPLPSFLELFRLFYALITCPDYVWGKYFFNLAKQYTPETKWPPLGPVTGG